jgi:hypothetical protein
MASYQPLGLGALLVSALRTAVTDPSVREQAEAASAAVKSLTDQVNELATDINDNDQLDTNQQETLAGIQRELQELADALTPDVIADVEPAAEHGGGEDASGASGSDDSAGSSGGDDVSGATSGDDVSGASDGGDGSGDNA